MTDEFLKRLQEANEKAINVYKKENEKFLEECKKNKVVQTKIILLKKNTFKKLSSKILNFS